MEVQMSKKKIGLLLRSYAKNPEDVPGVVTRAVKSIRHASSLRDENGEQIFTSIIVLIPREYDRGYTGRAILRQLETSLILHMVAVFEVAGHHSCGVLNHGIKLLDDIGIDFAVIVSNKAIEALTADKVEAMLEAFDKGAKVVGVAVDELGDGVIEGRIQNTLSGWDVKALLKVGGFDSEIGVEEISPTVRLVREYGPCIAPLVPHNAAPLDIREGGEVRHSEVIETKLTRQLAEVARVDSNFTFIQSGVMPDYPLTV